MTAPRTARYGPPDLYPSPPPGGLCISVFAVVRGEDDHRVLVGRVRLDDRWVNDWVPAWRMYDDKEELEEQVDALRLPSVYVHEGEHPDQALARLMREQLLVERYEATGPRVLSYTSASDWYPGQSHWDLVFVYDVASVHVPDPVPEWWRELGWMHPQELSAGDFGWNEDMMVDLKLVRA